MEGMDVFVTAGWLRARRPSVQIVDCRFDLSDPAAGWQAYLADHVPGASFLDLESDLSGAAGPGRHPLPDPHEFAAAARRAGIRSDVPVVAYDQDMAGGAARLWWLLRHIGKDDVAVLDGGFAAWDGPLRSGREPIEPGEVQASPRSGDTVDRDDVASHLNDPSRLLIDARRRERYRGHLEPVDPVAGHIPGARNVPFEEDPPGGVATSERELVVYCGSGVTACVVLARLAAAGRDDAKLYPGSWSDWCRHDLPVATGEEP